MSRIKDVSNIKNFVDTIDEISSDVDTNLNTIKGNLTELGISSSTFNKTNLINGLRNDPTIAPINTTDHKGDVEKVDADSYVGMPLNASLLKLGVSGRDPEDPATTITSNNNSRTLTTDRTDGNTTTIKRWATRCAFKFRSQDYGYDRCVYEIPTQYLMEGCVGTESRHATTFSKYPYPEEIIMISADNDKNFIHFVNAQYLDGHYNYYNGTAYNLMIVKDRTNWGVLDDAGTEFKKYISVYANNVEDSLAFYIEDNSGIGYITFPMPDRSFGDELLNTLWDCKVIWRSDAPDRDFNITVEGEYREEYVNEIDPTWSQGTMPSKQDWSSVCYGNGKFVAVSGGNNRSNIMAYSTDGIIWTQGNMPSSQEWQSVCYGNGKFVAVADNIFDNTTVAYSTNGINWTQGTMPSKQDWSSVCYGNGKFVAIARSVTTNIMAYSTDGIIWTQGNMPNSQYWQSVCYGNGKFVAIANRTTTMAYSTDGISWTEGNLPSDQYWYSVCYGNGKYVAVASNTNIMAYSTDGISWTQGNMPSNQGWRSVCYGNGKYVAVATDIMAYSTDGISWTKGNMRGGSWYSVCYGNNKYVAVVNSSTTMAYIPDSEFDLLKFKESSVSASGSRTIQSVCYGNGKYVAVATRTNTMAYSTDGINWTRGTMPSNQDWYSVCYGNDKYVAVAYDTNIMAYSTDGITWTEGNMPISKAWQSVCYGDGKYVAVATRTNTMAYSTDGINWTEGNMPRNEEWRLVCYGKDKFVAIAYNSNIMAYSTDGISWTQGNMPRNEEWNSVCYGNDKFVAVAYYSNIMAYSTDGISWTRGNMPSNQDWYSVCYGNGKYVAIATNNTNIMAYSTDGISWTKGNMPSNQRWDSVCYGNGKYVAVGSDAKIAYALSDYLFHPLFDLDKINGRVVLTEEYNTRLTKIRDTFDNFLETNAKLTQVNHSTLTDYNDSKLNLYQLPEYSKSTEFNIESDGVLYRLTPWGDYYICIANTDTNYIIKILDKSLSSIIDSYSNSHLSGITSMYLGGTTITENTPYRISFSIIIFYNGTDGQYRWNKIYNTFVKDPETGEISRDTGNSGSADGLVNSAKTINDVCQIANDKYLVFTDTGADLATVSDTVTIQENYGTKVKSSLLTHYGMVSIPNNAATIEANTNISFSDCGDEILSSIQSGNLYRYDDQSRYSDDVTGYEANDEGKALTAFDTGVFTTSTGKNLLLRAKLKFTFTSDFTLA